ncbi:MAG: hypothetical protein BA865_05990 [Desulfobacterales bacterium S5133MH4]|nr:MAG: hypothetical protein BA865_05990 [Desulfobacterales bacterium S5133MH4]
MKQVTIKLVLFAYLTVLIGMLGCGGSGGDGGEPDPGDKDIVGSWGRGHYSYDDVEYESITFYPNGYYIYCDSNSRDAEYGTWDYNKVTKTAVFTPIYNGTNEGPSEDGRPATHKAEVVNHELTVYGDNAVTVFDVYKRVMSNNYIVGGWGPGYHDGTYTTLTFYPNGHYIHWQTDEIDEPNDNGGGIEYGSYTYNDVNDTLIARPVIDENGCAGLSDNGVRNTLHVTATSTTLTLLNDDDEVDSTFERVDKEQLNQNETNIDIAGTWQGENEGNNVTMTINENRWTFRTPGYNTYGEVQQFSNDDRTCILKWGIGDIDEGEYSKIRWSTNSPDTLTIWIYDPYSTLEEAADSTAIDVGPWQFYKS